MNALDLDDTAAILIDDQAGTDSWASSATPAGAVAFPPLA
jgi:hypothetical protein